MNDRLRERPTLLYIMGAGRCGSTVLSIILGAHPEVESVGEIKTWPLHRGLPRDIDAKSEDFTFWSDVLAQYRKVAANFPDFYKLTRICREIESHHKLVTHMIGKADPDDLQKYYLHTSNLITSIHKMSSKKTILDSSKNVCRALTLLRHREINIKIIHLIRDPRGTVWSFMKKNVEQKPKKVHRAVLDYMILNGAATLVRYFYREKVMKVTYENLILQPAKVIGQILAFVGLDQGGVADMIESNAEFHVKHFIDGNRVRRNKTIKISPDEEWKTKMSRAYKGVSVLALPIYFL